MRRTLIFLYLLSASFTVFAQPVPTLTINRERIIAPIQPTMWGVFFEDINFAADGGLYAELVKNRSFEFADPYMGWDLDLHSYKTTEFQLINRGTAAPSNPRFLRLKITDDSSYISLTNEGFRGMGFRKGEEYDFSVMMLAREGSPVIRVELLDSTTVIASATINGLDAAWKKYSVRLKAGETTGRGKLKLTVLGKGVVEMDVISCFPVNTWKGRPGGLRADLVQWLADMKPGFVRFPGGCIVEGRDLANRYQWKKTVGDPNERQLIINRWNTEFQHKLTPDYFQSYGLGFYEYFLLAEDIGAAPLPILNCGMACQFNTSELVPLDQLDPYIQDALDLIEFANGSADTKWGKLRAAMGHPQPFNLTMMGVGNEQWGPQYVERYKIFSKAIHEKYPAIKLVSSVGPFAGGDLFNYLNPIMRELKADLLDEHYYMPPEFFLRNATRYDKYDRNGPKIFAGEYAAHVRNTDGTNRNNWQSALSEAAFMTGLERNADVVHMSSYAPLFAHVDAWQWAPDLIWFNSLNSYGTPNYYVQKMFATNKGTHLISVTENGQPLTGQDSLYASAVWDEATGETILKLVNASATERQRVINSSSRTVKWKSAQLQTLQADSLAEINSLANPRAIEPSTRVIDWKKEKATIRIPGRTVVVLRIK